MKRYLCLPFLFLFFILTAGDLKAEETWNLKKDSADIKVYTKAIQGSDLIFYKGVADIDAPIEVVESVINDYASYDQWYWQCSESKIIKSDASKGNIVFYVKIHPGWPVSDRDMVLYTTRLNDSKTGSVTYTIGSIQDAIVPKQAGTVRVTVFEGGWTLTKIGKNKTNVTYGCKVDPAGSIPKAIVNMNAIDAPFNSLKNLREMVKKNKYNKLSVSKS